MSEASPPAARLDVWLWRARFFKTRALAAGHVSKRGVRITRHGQTRRVDKPAGTVSPGDQVTFGGGGAIRTIEIIALGARRGPAEEARELYREIGGEDV